MKLVTFLTVKIYDNRIQENELLDVKVVKLGTPFSNQPSVKSFLTWAAIRCICDLVKVLGYGPFKWQANSFNNFTLRFWIKFSRLDTLVTKHPRNFLFSSPTNWRFGNEISIPHGWKITFTWHSTYRRDDTLICFPIV